MTEEPQKKRLKVMQSDDGDYEIFVRSQGLQHIAENIFGRLDLQCLLVCQIVCKSWNEFIKDEKSLWLSHLRNLKDAEMIEVLPKAVHIDDRVFILNFDEKFLSIFPKWKEIIGHFEAEHPTIIKKFLKTMIKYLKVNWKDSTNLPPSPLHYAIDNADTEFIDIMLLTKFKEMFNDRMVYRMLDQKLNSSLKLLLHTFKFSLDKVCRIFLDSCYLNNLDMLKYLINDLTSWFIYPILWNDYSLGQNLINDGLDVAANRGHANVVSFLLQSLSFKFDTNSSLHVACLHGHFEIVKLLLDHLTENPRPGYINDKNEMGDTPLMVACHQKKAEIVKLLLKQDDLQINLQDDEGETAFNYACQHLSLECVKLLLQHPNIDIKSNRERLPFHGLVLNLKPLESLQQEQRQRMKARWTEMLEFMCSLPNIDINDQDTKGRTVLHCACMPRPFNPGKIGDPELVKMILQQPDIDINAADENGETALRLAVKAQNFEIMQEIANYGMERGIKPTFVSLPPFPSGLL